MKNSHEKQNFQNTIICLSIFSALFFAFISTLILRYGHLHEDAYILYIYSENLAATNVVSYYSGGPPTEGATDFLWMVLIAIFNFFGVPSGVASATLNTIGVFFVTLIISKCAARGTTNWAVVLFIALFVPVSSVGQAAFMGFSTAFYSALIATMMYIGMFGRGRSILLIPILGLVLALVRPDGAVIGGLTTTLLYFVIGREIRLSYFLLTLGCAAVGIAYFLWRWSYFGEFLPLPLIVKSSADTRFPGLWTNRQWLMSMTPLVVVALYSLFVIPKKYKKIFAVSIPILTYFLLLTFTTQSQNVGYRFQAPVLVLLLFAAAITFSSADLSKVFRFRWGQPILPLLKPVVLLGLVIAIGNISVHSATKSLRLAENSIEGQYIDVFPYYLSSYLDDTSKIALTEAGRLAYWTPGMKYDLVGLNTAETAVNGASVDYLEGLDADLIMVHQAGMLSSIECEVAQMFCRIGQDEFTNAFNNGKAATALSVENRVRRAPSIVAQFLVDNFEKYAIYAVSYNGLYSHIYAINLSGNLETGDFETALNRSFDPDGQLSYLEIVAER